MATRRMVRLGAVAACLAAGGCGPKKAAPPPESKSSGDYDYLAHHDDGDADGLGVAGIFEGDLNADEVVAVTGAATRRVNDCFSSGRARNANLVGEVSLRLVVARDGRVRESVIEESDLGDRESERCLLLVASSLVFPKPRGGEVQMSWPLAYKPAGAGAGLRPRAGTEVEVEALHAAVEKICTPAGAAGWLVTVYVGTDGKAISAGFASPDIVDSAFADCVTTAAMGVTYDPSAGIADKVRIPGS